jgi:hypothetical protein
MNPSHVRCPSCGYVSELIREPGGGTRFPLKPEMAERCPFLIDQKQRAGQIDDWMCPTLKDEVEGVLYGRESEQ